MLAVVGFLGVLASVDASRCGKSRSGAHVGGGRPSEYRSSQLMTMSKVADLADRVGYCAISDLLKKAENGTAQIQGMSFDQS